MRSLIIVPFAAALFFSCSRKAEPFIEPVSALYDSALAPFYHGVASGDPLHDRVIIWTRVTPAEKSTSVEVSWEVSQSADFSKIVRQGSLVTGAERDFTVKVDVDQLRPGNQYYYRFSALNRISKTGRTRTLPDAADSLRFAIVSCSNWEFGYFNPYHHLSGKNLDAVLHLGDYLYEYATGKYGNSKVTRKNIPDHEIVTLEDYRTRYSQYHLDRNLREARQAVPFIAIWDDHEVANNVFKEGAQNHQEDEGDFQSRKRAARQAYYEWIPIRESDQHYRAFNFGDLAQLVMLDERLEGRVAPAINASDPSLSDSTRTMLGRNQLKWLKQQLSEKAVWKVIGNQVVFSPLNHALVQPDYPINTDSWDGYPFERTDIVNHILQSKIKNVIFATGDTHASWAFKVMTSESNNTPLAVELCTPSLSSGNANEYASDEEVKAQEANFIRSNPGLAFTNHRDHGYVLLTLKREHAIAEWFFVDTLLDETSREISGPKYKIPAGNAALEPF